NRPPTDVIISGPARGVRGQPLEFAGSFTDPDPGDTYTLRWRVTGPTGQLLAEGTDPTLRFTPADSGAYQLTFTVTDQAGGTASASQALAVGAVLLSDDRSELRVGGTSGGDHIAFIRGPWHDQVDVTVNGEWSGSFFTAPRLIAYGQGGDDLLELTGGLALPASLDGGPGNDTPRGGGGAH